MKVSALAAVAAVRVRAKPWARPTCSLNPGPLALSCPICESEGGHRRLSIAGQLAMGEGAPRCSDAFQQGQQAVTQPPWSGVLTFSLSRSTWRWRSFVVVSALRCRDGR